MDRTNLKLLGRSFFLVALPFLLPSCSDAPTTVDADGDLTEAEAVALAKSLGLESLAFGETRSAAAATAGAPQAAPSKTQTISITYSLTRPCFWGGTVDSSGRIGVQADTVADMAVVDITSTDVHHGCVFLVNDMRVAVSGDPDVTTTIHAASLAGEPQGTQSVGMKGGVRWVTDDGRSGRCSLDILVEANPGEAFESTRGEICGFTVDVTVQG